MSDGKLQRGGDGKLRRRSDGKIARMIANEPCCCQSLGCSICVNPVPSIMRVSVTANAYSAGNTIQNQPNGWQFNWDNPNGPDNGQWAEYVSGSATGTFDMNFTPTAGGVCTWSYVETAPLGSYTPTIQWKCHQTGRPCNIMVMYLTPGTTGTMQLRYTLYIASSPPPIGNQQTAVFYRVPGIHWTTPVPPSQFRCSDGFNNLPLTQADSGEVKGMTVNSILVIP